MANLAPVGTPQTLAVGPFSHQSYTIKRPFWSFFGRKFHVFSPDGTMVLFVKHPILKLKQEFTMYADESETVPLLIVRQRKVLSFNPSNDVIDAQSGQKVGSLRKRGLKSILRDTWDVLDENDKEIGLVQEDGAALLRRFLPILTGKWHMEVNGQEVAKLRQLFRFFTKEFSLDVSMNQGKADPRFALAASLLALMAEIHREQAG